MSVGRLLPLFALSPYMRTCACFLRIEYGKSEGEVRFQTRTRLSDSTAHVCAPRTPPLPDNLEPVAAREYCPPGAEHVVTEPYICERSSV